MLIFAHRVDSWAFKIRYSALPRRFSWAWGSSNMQIVVNPSFCFTFNLLLIFLLIISLTNEKDISFVSLFLDKEVTSNTNSLEEYNSLCCREKEAEAILNFFAFFFFELIWTIMEDLDEKSFSLKRFQKHIPWSRWSSRKIAICYCDFFPMLFWFLFVKVML